MTLPTAPKPSAGEFERFFELSPDLLAVGGDGYLTQVNPAWEDTLGWSEAELLGTPFIELVHPADRERTLAVMSHVSERGYEIHAFEHRCRHRERGWRWLLWSARSDGMAWYAVAKDVTERKRLEARAFEDPVTRLPNRAVVVDRLKHARARQARSGTLLAVLFVDLDGFKGACDDFGTEIGDRLIRSAAQRLRQLVRESDTVARLGADEFVILAEDVGERDNAAMLADRIVTGFREPLLHGTPAVLSASVGAALADRDRPCTAEELLREADTAMERAKGAGGARSAVFGPAGGPASAVV